MALRLNPLEFGADQLADDAHRAVVEHGLNPLEFGADQLAPPHMWADQPTVLIPSNSGLISWPSTWTNRCAQVSLNPLEFGADQLAHQKARRGEPQPS